MPHTSASFLASTWHGKPSHVLQRMQRNRGRACRLRLALARLSMHAVDSFHRLIVGLQVLVADRPRRRDSSLVFDHSEVLAAEPLQGGAVDLRVPSDEIVDAWMERLARRIQPDLAWLVALLIEDCLGNPVLRFLWQVVATLQQQDTHATVAQRVGKGTATHACPNNEDVVVVLHVALLFTSELTQALQGLDKEVLPPHDALIDAEVFALMIDSMLEDPFPARRLDGQKRWTTERDQNRVCIRSIALSTRRLVSEVGQLEQAAGCNGSGRALIGGGRVRLLPVIRRNAMRRSALDVEVGALLGGIEKTSISGEAVGGPETVEGPGLTSCPR